MAQLIHINGPPGAGKTALAQRYLEDHPLVLAVDIDDLRTSLGRWDAIEESKVRARDLAIALIECHLEAGHDVVLPQFIGRLEFIERLETTATRLGASFVEIILTVDPSVAAERFRIRRRELLSSSARHPESEVDDESVDGVVEAAIAQLDLVTAARPDVKEVPGSMDRDTTYQLLVKAVHTSE